MVVWKKTTMGVGLTYKRGLRTWEIMMYKKLTKINNFFSFTWIEPSWPYRTLPGVLSNAVSKSTKHIDLLGKLLHPTCQVIWDMHVKVREVGLNKLRNVLLESHMTWFASSHWWCCGHVGFFCQSGVKIFTNTLCSVWVWEDNYTIVAS